MFNFVVACRRDWWLLLATADGRCESAARHQRTLTPDPTKRDPLTHPTPPPSFRFRFSIAANIFQGLAIDAAVTVMDLVAVLIDLIVINRFCKCCLRPRKETAGEASGDKDALAAGDMSASDYSLVDGAAKVCLIGLVLKSLTLNIIFSCVPLKPYHHHTALPFSNQLNSATNAPFVQGWDRDDTGDNWVAAASAAEHHRHARLRLSGLRLAPSGAGRGRRGRLLRLWNEIRHQRRLKQGFRWPRRL